jgi:hypothetical protein
MIHMTLDSIGMSAAWIIAGLTISSVVSYAICKLFLWENDEGN